MTVVTVPPNYKPTEKEQYMNPVMLEYFRRKLMVWKEELLKESDETLDAINDGGMQEPDIADRATAETERALEFRTRDRYRKLINKIDSALRRIEEGEYGYCEETGEPIGVKRLEARPVATMTVEAQERHERHERTQRDEEDEGL
jgi:DnaK suppressor protein